MIPVSYSWQGPILQGQCNRKNAAAASHICVARTASKHTRARAHTHSHKHTHIYTHTHTQTCAHTRAHTSTPTHTHTHTHACAHTHIHTHTYTHTYTHTNTHTYTHAYTHTHTYTHTNLCNCVLLPLHTHAFKQAPHTSLALSELQLKGTQRSHLPKSRTSPPLAHLCPIASSFA